MILSTGGGGGSQLSTTLFEAILDLDYHHGNGTQSIFYSESNPMYVSLHGTPDYPFWWGSKDEQGEGDGMSFNVNRPLPQGTQDPEYLETLACVINDKINPYKPDLLVVSLGFDTFKLDPVGAFFLTTDCYEKIGRLVRDINVPTIIVLEGGYCVEYLGENCSRFFDGFLQKKE